MLIAQAQCTWYESFTMGSALLSEQINEFVCTFSKKWNHFFLFRAMIAPVFRITIRHGAVITTQRFFMNFEFLKFRSQRFKMN